MPFALVSSDVLLHEAGVPPSLDRTYSLRDDENGLAVSYLQADGRSCEAVFRAHAVDFTEESVIVQDEALSAAELAVAARVVLPLMSNFKLSDCWRQISKWSSSDLLVSVNQEVLVVESTSSLRNAMHAALVLSAAGGVFDGANFVQV